jgi:hypothetical protein
MGVYKIGIMKINCEGRFLLRQFITFCEQNEIVKQFTTIETFHQNNITTHKNKTILERVRCIANINDLTKMSLDRGCEHNTYFTNISPTCSNNGMSLVLICI